MTTSNAMQESPFPSRSQMLAERKKARRANKRSKLAGLARTGLLSALAVVTVGVPATGFVGPENTLTLPGKIVTVVQADTSWAKAQSTDVSEAVGLREVASAASRAKLRTPLEISECLQSRAASGDRVVNESAPIVWPLLKDSFHFSSPFGMRFHPVLGMTLLHSGMDMAGPLGTPIFAASDGVVVESHPQVEAGYWIRIEHELPDGTKYFTAYAHMYQEDVLVKEGDKVQAGQKIAAIGNTGTSTGPHLHFEVRDENNKSIDPHPWLKKHNARQPGKGCE